MQVEIAFFGLDSVDPSPLADVFSADNGGKRGGGDYGGAALPGCDFPSHFCASYARRTCCR
jgi:hypothetical protein